MSLAPSSQPFPPVEEKVPEGRLRGTRLVRGLDSRIWFRGINRSHQAGDGTAPPPRLLRHGWSDALFIALSFLHGSLLLLAPSIGLIALGLWWNANTISHNFIHRPFFRTRSANSIYSAGLSLLLGIPQTLWCTRHLSHHADISWRFCWSFPFVIEGCLITALWTALAAFSPGFFCTVYLPGFALGLGLCQLQGYYEHVRGPVSHYGRFYNLFFFNDGYHVEHHARPARHWSLLPGGRASGSAASRPSRWPAVLRWLEVFGLDSLERLVLKTKLLQRLVLKNHERAFRKVLPGLPVNGRIGIIGGGLFPRTALILQRLLPEASLTIIDANAENLRRARGYLKGKVEFRHGFYESLHSSELAAGLDLLVIPLAFVGDRDAIYRHPPAPYVLVHDWIWRRHKGGAVISWALLKCVNLVRQ